METSVTTIIDLDLKVGTNDNGDWTLCTAHGADGKKYKTFNEEIISKLKQAKKTEAVLNIEYDSAQKEYKGKAYTERTIRKVAGATFVVTPTKPTSAIARPTSGKDQSPEYWDNKATLEFQRMAHMSALKACTDIMAALLSSGVETYKFQDACQFVKVEADKLYAAYYKSFEGGNHGTVEEDFGPDTAINE